MDNTQNPNPTQPTTPPVITPSEPINSNVPQSPSEPPQKPTTIETPQTPAETPQAPPTDTPPIV